MARIRVCFTLKTKKKKPVYLAAWKEKFELVRARYDVHHECTTAEMGVTRAETLLGYRYRRQPRPMVPVQILEENLVGGEQE